MKFKQISFTLAAVLALGLAGCSKNEPVTPVADDANKAANSTADAVAGTVDAAKVEAAKVEAAKVDAAKVEVPKADATTVAVPADATKAAESAKDQGLIDKAKGLVAENKLSEASSLLQQLAGRTLTPEQTKLVDGLKEQIQKALSANAIENAGGAAGNLLKK